MLLLHEQEGLGDGSNHILGYLERARLFLLLLLLSCRRSIGGDLPNQAQATHVKRSKVFLLPLFLRVQSDVGGVQLA
jgi:hypothetical protein